MKFQDVVAGLRRRVATGKVTLPGNRPGENVIQRQDREHRMQSEDEYADGRLELQIWLENRLPRKITIFDKQSEFRWHFLVKAMLLVRSYHVIHITKGYSFIRQ